MKHLSAAQIVELAGGAEIAGAREHLSSCSRCRQESDRWEARIEALRELDRESLEPAELHRLRVMYRQLGPRRPESHSWLATLVRRSARQPAAVRGAASGAVSEYQAGHYTLLVHMAPADRRARVAVHGQLTSSRGGAGAGAGIMALSAAEGRAYVCDIDRFGEFRLEEVEPGRYRALWWVDDDAIEIADLEIGGDVAG